MEYKEHKECKGYKKYKDKWEYKEYKEYIEYKEHKECKGYKKYKDYWEYKEYMDVTNIIASCCYGANKLLAKSWVRDTQGHWVPLPHFIQCENSKSNTVSQIRQ